MEKRNTDNKIISFNEIEKKLARLKKQKKKNCTLSWCF